MIRYFPASPNGLIKVAAQGRNGYDTKEACEAWIEAAKRNTPDAFAQCLGDNATAQPFDCYDHGDPKGVYAMTAAA